MSEVQYVKNIILQKMRISSPTLARKQHKTGTKQNNKTNTSHLMKNSTWIRNKFNCLSKNLRNIGFPFGTQDFIVL